ncbi:hypothetical protein NUSPORA_02764 [Nucleospora cyclopteri]
MHHNKKDNFLPKILNSPPSDTISDISMNGDLIALSSWDSCVRIYRKIKQSYSTEISVEPFKIFQNLPSPILSVLLINPSLCIAGLSDGQLAVLEIESDSRKLIKAHQGPIKNLALFKNEFIITTSFDGFYKIFDSSFKEVHSVNVNAKIYAMDSAEGKIVMALDNKKVLYVDLNKNITKEFTTKFIYNTRSISLLPTSMGADILVGSVEGKAEVFSIESNNSQVLRIHRADDRLYAVNKVKFYNNSLILTGGSDGYLQLVNLNTRFKSATTRFNGPVTAMALNGNDLIVAVGDDWSKGYQSQTIKTEFYYVDMSRV